ncbi:hypothetical protein OG538_36010 [Streptomyces sp. NBC_01013]|nr:hypothetical protein OG538_36010 [Streptomyces sp. NBC_01013]
MSFAHFSSAFTFFNVLSWADSSVVVHGGSHPESTPSCSAQFRNVSAEPMPSFCAAAFNAAV